MLTLSPSQMTPEIDISDRLFVGVDSDSHHYFTLTASKIPHHRCRLFNMGCRKIKFYNTCGSFIVAVKPRSDVEVIWDRGQWSSQGCEPTPCQCVRGPRGRPGPPGRSRTMIPFSSGLALAGSLIDANTPITMGYGIHADQIVIGGGLPATTTHTSGFSFTVPADGMIEDVTVSSDIITSDNINGTPLLFVLELFISPSTADNVVHVATPYELFFNTQSPPTNSVQLMFGILPIGGEYTIANRLSGMWNRVRQGDRINIQVRASSLATDALQYVTWVTFSGSLTYSRD